MRNISGLLSSWPEGATNRAHQRRRKIRGARMTHTGESPVEKLIQETTGFDENGMYRKAVLDVSLACKTRTSHIVDCMFSAVHATDRLAVRERSKMFWYDEKT